jgi:hypothetical protein
MGAAPIVKPVRSAVSMTSAGLGKTRQLQVLRIKVADEAARSCSGLRIKTIRLFLLEFQIQVLWPQKNEYFSCCRTGRTRPDLQESRKP